jgi:hypothetical protein
MVEAVHFFENVSTNLPCTTQKFTTMKTLNFSYFLLESVMEKADGYKDVTAIAR